MFRRAILKSHFVAFALIYSIIFAPLSFAAAKEEAKPKSKFAALVEVITVTVGAFFVSACGSGSSSNVTISGAAALGELDNATVSVIDLTNGAVLATGVTDTKGDFNLSATKTDHPCVVSVSGKNEKDSAGNWVSSYTDESTGTKAYLKPTETFRAPLAKIDGDEETGVSDVTEMVTQLAFQTGGGTTEIDPAKFASMSADDMQKYMDAAAKQLISAVGGDTTNYAELFKKPSHTTDAGNPNFASYVAAKFSELRAANGISAADGAAAALAMGADFADGKIDGLYVGGAAMPAAYAGPSNNWESSTLGMGAMDTRMKSNANMPDIFQTFASSGYQAMFTGTVNDTPPDFAGSMADMMRREDNGLTNPCTTDPNSKDCPTSPVFDPKLYDAFVVVNGGYQKPPADCVGCVAYNGTPGSPYEGIAVGVAYTSLSAAQTACAALPPATLMVMAEVSGSNITVTLKKADNTNLSGDNLTACKYEVKKWNYTTSPPTPTEMVALTSVSSNPISLSSYASGQYNVEVKCDYSGGVIVFGGAPFYIM